MHALALWFLFGFCDFAIAMACIVLDERGRQQFHELEEKCGGPAFTLSLALAIALVLGPIGLGLTIAGAVQRRL